MIEVRLGWFAGLFSPRLLRFFDRSDVESRWEEERAKIGAIMCFLVDGVLTLPRATFSSLTSSLVFRFIGDKLPYPRLSSMIMAL